MKPPCWLAAYAQIKDTLTKPHKGRIKERWDLLDKYGYYPFDVIKGESVSRTLECAYDDWCAGVMADKLGFKDDAEFFFKRSENWRNVFDPSIGLVEADPAILDAFEKDYRLFPRIVVSALSGEGLKALENAISGKICCFAGQSAVGKSSLMNALLPELDLPVGELTRKTDRGKHTTRHAQLCPCFGGALLDTPGFSLYEPESFDEKQLQGCYPEFAQAAACRFPGCMHISEPGCGVKELLRDGRLSPARYERYVEIAKDFIFRRKHQYD